MQFNLELNIGNSLKLLFLVLLLVAHIIFIINEHQKPKELQIDPKHLNSGILIDTAAIKKIGGYSLGVIGFLSGVITIKSEIVTHKNQSELDRKIQEASELKTQITALQQQIVNNTTTNTTILDSSGKLVSSLKSAQTNLNTINDNLVKFLLLIQNNQNTKNEQSQILKQIEEINSSTDKAAKLLNNAANSAKLEADKILSLIEPKKNLVLFSDLLELLDKYEGFGKIFISLLIFKYLIIGSCLSILFIIYGNYLIEKFNIQSKYPKIYKILVLRIKYQKYYLIMNISFILIVCITEAILIFYLLY